YSGAARVRSCRHPSSGTASRPPTALSGWFEMSMPWLEMSAEEFEMHVAAAIDQIPDELAALIDNCVILVEDYPPPDIPEVLGLYSGIPLTERGQYYSGLPDRILIFRHPILAICDTYQEVIEEVRITVVHEIAHHFGIDDDRLRELGYG